MLLLYSCWVDWGLRKKQLMELGWDEIGHTLKQL